MNSHDQRFLVIGAVENADAPALGQADAGAPKEIVVQLGRGGGLEGKHLAALGVDAGHDVLDRTILARRVHRLENEQNGPSILRVESLLQRAEQFLAVFQGVTRVLLAFEAARVCGIEMLQAELGPLVHSITGREPVRFLDQVLGRHCFHYNRLGRRCQAAFPKKCAGGLPDRRSSQVRREGWYRHTRKQ